MRRVYCLLGASAALSAGAFWLSLRFQTGSSSTSTREPATEQRSSGRARGPVVASSGRERRTAAVAPREGAKSDPRNASTRGPPGGALARPSSAAALSAAGAERELAREAQTAPSTPERRPWRYAGFCTDIRSNEQSSRERYLATFVPVEAPPTMLYVEPAVPEPALVTLKESLSWMPSRVKSFVGLAADPPVIYVYANAEALRAHACLSESTVAYYDGAIHLALSRRGQALDPVQSLKHEYVHHALQSHRIELPIWFQEGAAMVFAGESWFQFRFTNRPIELEQMVERFPHTAAPAFAEAFYGQAFAMVTLLQKLCGARKECSEAELVHALRDGSSDPETLFTWALRRRAPNVDNAELDILSDFVARGFRLSPALLAAVRLETAP